MNVYDFDGTIYNGDSSIDFWLYCLYRNPLLCRFIPKQVIGVLLYKLGKISKEKYKSIFFSFFLGINKMNEYVKNFWDKREKKINTWYIKIRKSDDCIISASPRFLLEEICNRINVTSLIATSVDKRTGELIGKNCHDINKPEFFKEVYNNTPIDCFYSDSLTDLPMAKMANKFFFVRKSKIIEWQVK